MYTYKLEITSIYDGDTLNGVVDLGFNIRMDVKIRLGRIDTPEIRTKDPEEKAAGYAARDWLREFCEKYKDGLLVQTTKKGKYGRWIGDLLLLEDDFGHDEDLKKYVPSNGFYYINDMLVGEGHAVYRDY